MKVLWFTNTPSCYQPEREHAEKNGYNGGGWIASAEQAIKTDKNITLSVSFILDGQPKKVEQNGVTYYPIKGRDTNILAKINNKLKALSMSPEMYENAHWPFFLHQFKFILEDFKPDIIHIWGSELWFGLIWKITDIPVVLHIQGIINPYFNAYNPPGMSWKEISKKKNFLGWLKDQYEIKSWRCSVYREKEIFKGIKAFLGRTDWDRRVAYCLNSNAKYFHVDEILRESFYKSLVRELPNKLRIVTTISSPLYKGYDMVLKTAKLLKENLNIAFEWNCYGNIDPKIIEKVVGIRHQDVCVHLMGVASSEQLQKAELSATLYFHPSYIDNSPNSLCEAQMLGLPIIATNVGGIPSLVKDGRDGYLIPANDPYQAAYLIHYLFNHPELNINMGKEGQKKAITRHDPQNIVEQIYSVYRTILS